MLSYPKMFHVKRMGRRGRKTKKVEKKPPTYNTHQFQGSCVRPNKWPLKVGPFWTRPSGGTSGCSTNQRLDWHTWPVSDGKFHQLESGFVPSQGAIGGQPGGIGAGQGIASLIQNPGRPSCQIQTPECQNVSRCWPNLVSGNWFTLEKLLVLLEWSCTLEPACSTPSVVRTQATALQG